MSTQPDLPERQRAVQLVGPDRLVLNADKEVLRPGPHQFLCRVVVVGLCFSDLKLLKQFSNHVRKAKVASGIDPEVLAGLPTYAPGDRPTVPGHEPVVEVVEAGPGVTGVRPGERYFIQADWRWLRTAAQSNGALGYNFEGALQEYLLLDERVVTAPDGESMLLPAPRGRRSAAAFALVEPWACVEQSYQVRERRTLKAGGRLLVVADAAPDEAALAALRAEQPPPASVTWVSAGRPPPAALRGAVRAPDPAAAQGPFDDLLYFGSDPGRLPALFEAAAPGALILLAACGGAFGRPAPVALGAVHYRGVRLAGTPTADPAAALATVPAGGELREGDTVHVVGAGGPMGVMHVIRNLCQGVKGIRLVAADLSDERLAALDRLAGPVAAHHGVPYRSCHSPREPDPGPFTYSVVMAPVPSLVAAAVAHAGPRAIINLFAGIPVGVGGELDLDRYVRQGAYLVGTSGSEMSDMRIVLEKVAAGRLDTNVSVAAVSGLDGAVEGIRAVEKQLVPGKIMVYPACRGLGLTRLEDLAEAAPEAAAALCDGVWTREAEDALLARYAG